MVDDYTYLADAIGALPDSRETLDGALTPEVGDPFLVEHAASFPAYLLDHITVRAGGRRCVGRILPIDSLAAHGVDIDYRCAAPVSTTTVGITMLADLSTLYTTIATGPDGTQQVYTGTETSHVWSLAGTAAPAHRVAHGSPVPYVAGGLVIVLALSAAAVLVVRRRRAVTGAHAPALVSPDRAPPARVS